MQQQQDSEIDPATGKVRVFVYGSLKERCGNHVLLQEVGAKCLGYDSITGDFRMMSFGGFPGVVRDKASRDQPLRTIFGELYWMDDGALDSLDMLEGHPNWYERRKYRTDVLDYRAWMYTLPGGEGYLDKAHYDQVGECIWQPAQEELEFWDKQSNISVN